ncbi:rCG57902 [Rattus norvegicus]|uniref:RCG57902 n=1 Tax=Rattus norvegicus TaxID=10116 RepID=A6J3S6_RAT|nr:rCG57902 [Rattus norvegicus]
MVEDERLWIDTHTTMTTGQTSHRGMTDPQVLDLWAPYR